MINRQEGFMTGRMLDRVQQEMGLTNVAMGNILCMSERSLRRWKKRNIIPIDTLLAQYRALNHFASYYDGWAARNEDSINTHDDISPITPDSRDTFEGTNES